MAQITTEKNKKADALKAKSNVGLLHPKLENTQTSITSGDTRVAGAFSRNFVFCFFAAAPRVKLRITARGATVRRRAPLRGAGRLRDFAFEGFASCCNKIAPFRDN